MGLKLNFRMEAALEASGVVHGEYGFVTLYERRKTIVDEWLNDERTNVRAFSEQFAKEVETSINSQRRRAEESIALRRLEYGEDVGDLNEKDDEEPDSDG